ncbi:MAG: MBL fold metallo-hydrolase [Clostridiales bacterium]|jgi:glyoxylase-like metal-dependent hydrolase (beta-lactamase superfamily II)|nr:MBL fold metallo-hydrolase [Clostridiales bacterium]
MEKPNIPIMSELKSQVIKCSHPIDPISWAYMKELREHNKTKKVYAVDPYAEVYQFRDNLYGIYTDNADGGGAPWMFLIIGPEKAMLIDTSFGIGDLKGLINEITGNMPLVVANTHAAYDHSFGNHQFDQIHCHEYSVPRMLRQYNSHIWDYLFDENGKNKWLDFDRDDIPPFKDYEIVPCRNGHVFDLGKNYKVELVWLPGHQPGHSAYLDRNNRILFAGDDTCSETIGIGGGPKPGVRGDPYNKYATVTAFRDELSKLVERMDEYDSVFPSHFIVDVDSSIMKSILDTCNAIIANKDSHDYLYDTNGFTTKRKFIRGYGTLQYRDSVI